MGHGSWVYVFDMVSNNTVAINMNINVSEYCVWKFLCSLTIMHTVTMQNCELMSDNIHVEEGYYISWNNVWK
jgi:hypothetical protein